MLGKGDPVGSRAASTVGSASRLVEREHELERLQARLQSARSDRGSVLLIEGPPGIGKTALLDAARGLAREAGMTVLSARAVEFERGLGFSVVRSLIGPELARHSPRTRASMLVGAAELAKSPLELGTAEDRAPIELGSALHGLYWLSANLAELNPVLIAVDDLHWADEPSLTFLTYLARRASELPLVVFGTTRPAENEPAARLLMALGAEAEERLRPRALSPDGVGRLVRAALSADAAPEFCAGCAHASGGNPFLLMEALAAMRADGIAPTAAEAKRVDDLDAETLSRALLARIARLGAPASRVATATAILGSDAELRRIAALAELDLATTGDAIEGLRREGILAGSGVIEFAHPLIRNAVYSDVAEPARGLAHLRAAKLLGEEGEGERIAPHLLLAERNGDPWVVERLREGAAAALSRGAPPSAVPLLERALAEPPVAAERARLGLDLGRALTRSGALEDAAEVLRRALDLEEDPLDRIEIALDLARALRLGASSSEAVTVLEQAAEELPPGNHDEEIALETEIGMASHMGRVATEWIGRLASAAARARGDGLPDRSLRAFYSYVAAANGSLPAAEVAAMARSSIGDGEVADPPFLLQTAAAGLSMGGAFVEGVAALDRALETSRDLGDVVQFGFVSLTRSWVASRAGRVEEAEADARAGLFTAREGHLDLPYAVGALVTVLIERDELEAAESALAEYGLTTTTELATAPGAVFFGARGRLHRVCGRPREAIADCERSGTALRELGCGSPVFAEWRGDTALSYLALGETDKARTVATEDLDASRACEAAREIGMALRTLGLVEKPGRATDLLAESVEVLSATGARLELARSLVEHGAALRRAGRRADARKELRRGLDLAMSCGALALVARGRAELKAAGGRPRRDRLTGVDALTASEVRVARLAAEGRSNPEIAQSLFVTRRTVEVHLTNVYRKLEISSRDELPRALEPPS